MDLDEVDCILFKHSSSDLQFYLFIVINKLLFVLFLEGLSFFCFLFLFCIIIGLKVVFFTPQGLHT